MALNPSPAPAPSILKILRIYSYMTHGITIKTLCARTSPRENNIDERYSSPLFYICSFILRKKLNRFRVFIYSKLVIFGILHRLIRCINKYPVFISEAPINRQRLYTGAHHIDEICCRTGLTLANVQEDIENDPSVVTICK